MRLVLIEWEDSHADGAWHHIGGGVEDRALICRSVGWLVLDGERVKVVALQEGWTRLGRSLSAHVRFDDPTVSRRHALIVRQADGVRVLDDRSLNGVFVNGDRVEWSSLHDGDEVLVGCHSLRYVEVAPSGSERPAQPPERRQLTA